MARIIGLLILFISFPGLCADTHPDRLEYLSGQTLFYADESYTLSWSAQRVAGEKLDSLVFSIRYANGTILTRYLTPGQKTGPTVTFRYPKLRWGVTVKTTALISSGNRTLYKQTFYFVSKTPPPRHLIPAVGIMEGRGTGVLETFLKHINIPYTRISSPEGFKGKWIICSGLDFSGTGVFSQLIKSAGNGVSILVLPPYKGRIVFPEYKRGMQVDMGDESLIKILHCIKTQRKNNTAQAVARVEPGSIAGTVFLKPVAVGNKAGISFEKNAPGFTWLQFKFKKGGVFFCGWDLGKIYLKNPYAAILIAELVDPGPAK